MNINVPPGNHLDPTTKNNKVEIDSSLKIGQYYHPYSAKEETEILTRLRKMLKLKYLELFSLTNHP